jgi:hypothetical protein
MSSLVSSGTLAGIMAEMDHKVRHENLDVGRLLQSAMGMLTQQGPMTVPPAQTDELAPTQPASEEDRARAAALAAVEGASRGGQVDVDPSTLLEILSGLPGGGTACWA